MTYLLGEFIEILISAEAASRSGFEHEKVKVLAYICEQLTATELGPGYVEINPKLEMALVHMLSELVEDIMGEPAIKTLKSQQKLPSC